MLWQYTAPMIALVCVLVPALIIVHCKAEQQRTKRWAIQQKNKQLPIIAQTGNPFRIGAPVIIREQIDNPEYDWGGVVLGRANGSLLVRDMAYPYAVANCDPSLVFPHTAESFIAQSRWPTP